MNASKVVPFCVDEIKNYSDKDSFVSDLALSSAWGGGEAPESRTAWLSQLWMAAKAPMREIVKSSGMSWAAFGGLYCIPRRTLEDWISKETCPIYTKLLILESQGKFTRIPPEVEA